MTADVLVVGAGPAGSAAAFHLAARGVRVRLLDARPFPRSKPCGDALSPGALPLLEELGVRREVEARGARIAGWRLRAPGGRWFEGRFDPTRGRAPAYGVGLPRATLDLLLLEAAIGAGADFRARRRVFGLEREPAGVRLGARGPAGEVETHAARVVIGADGLRSRMARLFGGIRWGPRRRLALVRRLPDSADPTPPPPGFGEMRISGNGVLGRAPTGSGSSNLTLVVPLSEARTVVRNPAVFFRERVARYGLEMGAPERASGASGAPSAHGGRGRGAGLEIVGPFEFAPLRTTIRSGLLAGDAAGYFDPFTGQGVYRALVTGRLAALAAFELLEEPARERAIRRLYETRLRRFLGPGRRVQRLIDAFVSRPGLMDRASHLLAARPGLADLLVDLTGDRLPPPGLGTLLFEGARALGATPTARGHVHA